MHSTACCQALANGTAQNLQISSLTQAQLKLVVGLNFSQLFNNGGIIDIQTTKTRKSFCCGLMLVLLDEETWCLGKNKHSNDQDDSPGKLDSHRDPVGASVIAILGRVVDDGRQQQANGDG